jgi:hypothetical protein
MTNTSTSTHPQETPHHLTTASTYHYLACTLLTLLLPLLTTRILPTRRDRRAPTLAWHLIAALLLSHELVRRLLHTGVRIAGVELVAPVLPNTCAEAMAGAGAGARGGGGGGGLWPCQREAMGESWRGSAGVVEGVVGVVALVVRDHVVVVGFLVVMGWLGWGSMRDGRRAEGRAEGKVE